MKLKMIRLPIILLLVPLSIIAQKTKSMEKITINNHTQKIDINNLEYWVMNDGKGATDPTQANALGSYFPKGTTKSVVYQDGIVWTGKVIYQNGKKELRAGGSNYRTGLQSGKILSTGVANGTNYTKPVADDSSNPSYKIYKIQKNWEALTEGAVKDNLKSEYENWPINQGAPQKNNVPDYKGDQVLFYVSNDLDSVKTNFFNSTNPIGLEVQTAIYAFKTAPLNNSVFIRKLIINKSGLTVDSMFISVWSDPDLGNGGDDLVGVDTSLKTAFVYNGATSDAVYGTSVPALGYTFFQTPKIKGLSNDKADFNGKKITGFKNQNLSSFYYYLNSFPPDPVLSDPPFGNGASVLNKNQQGFDQYGGSLRDNAENPTKFPLSGNPVTSSGDLDGIKHVPDDRRFLLSSGPFIMAPGDSQEVIIGITVGLGANRLASITALKNTISSLSKSTILSTPSDDSQAIRNFNLFGSYPNPFNPSTTIEFNLESASSVSVDIFNLLGQKIKTIQNGFLTSGIHSVIWNGKDEKSKTVGSGLYFARISDGKTTVTQKLILAK